jgi:hypothetical protein
LLLNKSYVKINLSLINTILDFKSKFLSNCKFIFYNIFKFPYLLNKHIFKSFSLFPKIKSPSFLVFYARGSKLIDSEIFDTFLVFKSTLIVSEYNRFIIKCYVLYIQYIYIISDNFRISSIFKS